MIIFRQSHSSVRKTFCFLSYFFLALFGLNNHAKAQYIIAGTHTAGDVFVDIVPDSIQQAVASHWSPFPNYDFRIDLDSNTNLDLAFLSSGGGGLGGGSAGSGINMLLSNVQIAAHYDTFQICCPTDVYRLVADSFSFGDTISNELVFVNDNVMLWSDGYGNTTTPNIPNWLDIGEHYVAVRICNSFDSLYCWVKINVTYVSNYKIEIMEYACNKSTVGISLPVIPLEYAVYPSPFSNELYVNIGGNSGYKIVVYNLEGKKLIEEKVYGLELINTRFLSSGIYFYEMTKEDLVIGRGKIFKN